jgi:MerR family transcriptional regulator, copper efflux regulator
MLINELAKKTGLSAHTIRYYEKYGLIKGTRKEQVKSNNYYHYDEETVYKLELVRDAKQIGFTLNEIKHLIDSWYSKRLSKQKKLTVLDEKARSIDEKIAQLKTMKKLIAAFKKEVEEFDC